MTPLEEQVEEPRLRKFWPWPEDQGPPEGWPEPPYIALSELVALLRLEATDLPEPLPLEVTDGEARITDEMVEAGAKALGEWGGRAMPGTPLNRELSRACLSAALTQKGEPRACTGCANGCAGCKGKGKPYGEELMRQLRQGQKGENE